ncbi:MAG: outer membrane protein assembly factor BamD [Bacteroidota bacterium]
MRILLFVSILILLNSCHGINKIIKNPDPNYKLRMAEQYYVKKKYNFAQQLFEDIMPYFKTGKEFEDIYYKYAYCAYYQQDYLNAENLYKTFLEIFPNSARSEEMDYMRAYCYYKQSPKSELDQTNTIKSMGMMQIFINTHPGSSRAKEASDIIDICRDKLEKKDFLSAQLYYDIGQFRAAGVAFASLLNAYPESKSADLYHYMIVKSNYRFADELSAESKQVERFEQVILQGNDFIDRFPDSKLAKEVEHYINLSKTNIKTLTNEQT